jgi:hypothetical protein
MPELDCSRVDRITVERCEPNFNDLSWQTFELLTQGQWPDNPGDDEDIAILFRVLLGKKGVLRPDTTYANPCGAVRSAQADNQFFRIAKQLRDDWFARFNLALCSSRRVKAEMDRVHPIIRQLTYTGVLFVEGRHAFPNQWPATNGRKPPDCFTPRKRRQEGREPTIRVCDIDNSLCLSPAE